MNDQRSVTDLQQQNERDDAIYQEWQQEREHDPSQPLTRDEWQDFYTTWSRETDQTPDPEQAEANPFKEDMQLQELDPDQIPPLSELVEEKDLDLDLQELDERTLTQDELQPDADPLLLEPSSEPIFEDKTLDRDMDR